MVYTQLEMGRIVGAAHTYFRHCELISGRGWVLFINASPVQSTMPGTELQSKLSLLNLAKMRYWKCFLSSSWKNEIEAIHGGTLDCLPTKLCENRVNLPGGSSKIAQLEKIYDKNRIKTSSLNID